MGAYYKILAAYFILVIIPCLGEAAKDEGLQVSYQRRLSPSLGVATTTLNCGVDFHCILKEESGETRRHAQFVIKASEEIEIASKLRQLHQFDEGERDSFKFIWQDKHRQFSHVINLQSSKPVALAAEIVSLIETHFKQ